MKENDSCNFFLANRIPAVAGVGLRAQHYQQAHKAGKNVAWYEVHPENYFGEGGIPHVMLEKIRADHPLSFHGVGMSLASIDKLDTTHLRRLKQLISVYNPGLVSEHISWSSIDGVYFNDLLPIPYTEESLLLVSDKIDQVQNELGRQILVENASTYIEFIESTIPEVEFINALVASTQCGILLDVNNLFVNACNHSFDSVSFISNLTANAVQEIHLAGHTVNKVDGKEIRIDSHDRLICDEVWQLYDIALQKLGVLPTLIEWDTNLPEFNVLCQQAFQAQNILNTYHVRAS